jgi:predicted ATP-grasp superfamily ATP-dependent carboligase
MGDVAPPAGVEGGDVLPRIAVVYDVMSITPMVLAEAASGLCRIVWVVDGGDPVMGPMVRLLRRLGEVVDRAGLDTNAVTSAVASHQPSGILTFAEAQMPFTAAIAERLSLTYHSVLTANRLADKFLQRQALQDAGLPGPAVWEAPTPGQGEQEGVRAIEELAGQVTYPVVVKPRRGTSSVATARADDERQLSELLTRFGAQEGGLLVEEYLADRVSGGTFADDIAVELLAQGGRVWHLATTGKFAYAPPFRGRGCFLPSHVDAETEAELFAAAEAGLRAVGITDGFANVDLKLTPEGARVVEVNGRLGGNVDVLMELAGGPKILPLLFRLALGEDMAAEPAVARVAAGNWARVAYFAWIQTPMSATRLSGIEGLDEVAALPHVVTVVRNQRQGDPLDWARGGRFNVGEVFGIVDDIGSLAAARDEIDGTITLEFEEDPQEAQSSETQ